MLVRQLTDLSALYPGGLEDEALLGCLLGASPDRRHLLESLVELPPSAFQLQCIRLLLTQLSDSDAASERVASHIYQLLFVSPKPQYQREVAALSRALVPLSSALRPPLSSVSPLQSGIAEEEWADGADDTRRLVLKNTLAFYRQTDPAALLAPVMEALSSECSSPHRKSLCLEAIRGGLYSQEQLPWETLAQLDDDVLGRVLCSVRALVDRPELWPLVERLILHQDGKRAIYVLMNVVDAESPGWRAFFALFTETRHHRSIHLLKPIWNSMMRDMVEHNIPHPFVRVLYTKALDDKEQLKEVGKVAILQALFVSEPRYHRFIDEQCLEQILSTSLHAGLSSLIMRQLMPQWLRKFQDQQMLCRVAVKQLCKLVDYPVNLQLLEVLVDLAPPRLWSSSELVERALYYCFRQTVSNQRHYLQLLVRSFSLSSDTENLSAVTCCAALEKSLSAPLYRANRAGLDAWIASLPRAASGEPPHFLMGPLDSSAPPALLRAQLQWTGVHPAEDQSAAVMAALRQGSQDANLAALAGPLEGALLEAILEALSSDSRERQYFAVAVCGAQETLPETLKQPLISLRPSRHTWTPLWSALSGLADAQVAALALDQVDTVSPVEIAPLIHVARRCYSEELLAAIHEVLINARKADGGKQFSENCSLWARVALDPPEAADVNPRFIEGLVALEERAGISLAGLSLHVARTVGFPRWRRGESMSLLLHFLVHGVPIVERQTLAETLDPRSDYSLRFTLPRLVALLHLTEAPAAAALIVLRLFERWPPATHAYFDSSLKALLSMRMWQVVCLLGPQVDHETMEKIIPYLIAAIDSFEGKYQRKLMCTFSITTLTNHPDLAPPVFEHFFEGTDAGVLSDAIIEHLVLQIAPFCQSIQAKIRGHAQTLVFRLSKMDLHLGHDARFLLDSLSAFLVKNYNVTRFEANFAAGEIPDCDWESICCRYPAGTMVSEWMPPAMVNQMAAELGLEFRVSLEGPEPQLEKGASGLFFDPAGDQLGAYQRKPAQLLELDLEVAEAHRTRAPLVVCASLVDRAPNLGGLTRTCEIFNAELLTMSKKDMFMKTRDFLNTAVSSDKHQPILEVNERDVVEYLEEKRRQGYSLVGMEQSESSESLLTFQFPEKCVLVLGHEKTGMPQHLIDMLDFLVEIPQYGIIRSLNVHVSASLLIWTYTQQHTSKRA